MTGDQANRPPRLRGLIYSKLFPNPAEPGRGVFVAEQLDITAAEVDWCVIAPVPWVPKVLSSARRPHVTGEGSYHGVPVARPRYLVLPKRMAYTSVGAAMAKAAAPAFDACLAKGSPQFVHAHTLYPAGEAALLNADGRLPVVVTVHGSDLRTNLARPAWRDTIARVAERAAAVVCVSTALADELVRELGADRAKVLVIPNSFDDATFDYVERATHEGPTRLVAVGNLVPVKGFDVAIEAVARAVEHGADVELTIVGRGPQRAALEALASGRGVADRIRFTGYIEREQLAEEYARADAVVVPSRQEGFGVALVEALATGLPAVVTRSGGPDEILGGSMMPVPGSGLTVRPDDAEDLGRAIAEIAANLDGYDRKAISADAHARFGRRTVATRLSMLYREVVEGRPLTSTIAQGDA